MTNPTTPPADERPIDSARKLRKYLSEFAPDYDFPTAQDHRILRVAERLIAAQTYLGRAIERLAAAQMYHREPGLKQTAGRQCRQNLDAAQSQIAEANHWLGQADALEERAMEEGEAAVACEVDLLANLAVVDGESQ